MSKSESEKKTIQNAQHRQCVEMPMRASERTKRWIHNIYIYSGIIIPMKLKVICQCAMIKLVIAKLECGLYHWPSQRHSFTLAMMLLRIYDLLFNEKFIAINRKKALQKFFSATPLILWYFMIMHSCIWRWRRWGGRVKKHIVFRWVRSHTMSSLYTSNAVTFWILVSSLTTFQQKFHWKHPFVRDCPWSLVSNRFIHLSIFQFRYLWTSDENIYSTSFLRFVWQQHNKRVCANYFTRLLPFPCEIKFTKSHGIKQCVTVCTNCTFMHITAGNVFSDAFSTTRLHMYIAIASTHTEREPHSRFTHFQFHFKNNKIKSAFIAQ